MLPKLSHPTFELVLPSNGKTVKYRPFLVKEHKTFMKAIEFDDQANLVNTFKNILTDCTFGELDFTKTPMFDVEYIYLKMHGNSAGSITTSTYRCNNEITDEHGNKKECGTKIDVDIDIDRATVDVPKTKESFTIMLDEEKKIGIKLKYPNFEDYMKFGKSQDADDLSIDFIISCIDMIFDSEAVYLLDKDFTKQELIDYIDNFDKETLDKISSFIENIPDITLELEIKCPKCGAVDKLVLRGLDDFLA